MVELDYDQVLDELTKLSKKPEVDNFPEILERYLEKVAKNGDTIFPWSKVKPFIRRKLEVVMETFHRENPPTEAQMMVPNCKPFDFADNKMEIMRSFDWFYAAPFTVQRLCELLLEPGKHYRRTDKLMRGLEKNVLVVSTIQPRQNKYATPETMEKQGNFREMYPMFNNHSSSSSSGSSSSSPGGLQNGSHENAQSHNAPNNSYDPTASASSPYLNSGPHSLGNSFYDHAPPPPPPLNNHHHHHLLDTMGEGGVVVPPSLQHPHSLAHHPLQQLDSFTNVFATTTTTSHHHLTHLNSAYSLESTSTTHQQVHLTNGSAGGHPWHEIKTNPYDALLHSAGHGGADHLNDDNENIIVDDDEEDEKEEDERGRGLLLAGQEEKDNPYYYTDSSNSSSNNTSDSSSYNSDNSNDKDDAGVKQEEEDTESQQEPISSSEAATISAAAGSSADNQAALIGGGSLKIECSSSPSHEFVSKKRPSPTPPNEPEEAVGDEDESKEAEGISKEAAPLTPKKLKIDSDEEGSEATTVAAAGTSGTVEEAEESGQIELKEKHVLPAVPEDDDEEVETEVSEPVSSGIGAALLSSTTPVDELGLAPVPSSSTLLISNINPSTSSTADDSIPMDLNADDDGQPLASSVSTDSLNLFNVSASSSSKNDADIPMHLQENIEGQDSPDDQMMDEPMDQE